MIPRSLSTSEGRPILVAPTRDWKFRTRAGRSPAVHLVIGGGRIALTTDEAVNLADALHDTAESLEKEN